MTTQKVHVACRSLLAALLVALMSSLAGAQTLPSPWTSTDVGRPAVSGSATYASGRFTIKGAGSDIWGSSDQFQFVYQPVTGDVEIVARVVSITRAHTWSKAGVMIRESLAAGSTHATMFASAAKGYAFQRRPDTAGMSVTTSGPSGAPPGWIRLVRAGDLFTAYQSSDGVNWRLVGSDTIPMGDTVYVGLPVTSHNASTATTAVMDSVKVTPKNSLPNNPPAVSITAPVSSTQYPMPASIAITANATDPEGAMLSVDFYANQTLISRDTAAPYSATFATSTAGSYSLTAIAHDADGNSTTSGAVPVTVQAASNGMPTVALTSPGNGASFAAPATVNLAATASDPEGQLTRVEFFNGTTLLGSDTTAPYTFAWTSVAAGTYTLTAAAYDAASNKTTSAAVSVTVTGAAVVPAPWTAADIGAPALAGSTTYSAGTFTVDASGIDIWGTSDQFRFVYQPISGDVQITARVDSQTATNEWANSGVMIRTSLAANAAFAYMASTAQNGLYFRQRMSAGATTSSTAGAAAAPPAWVRLVRQGAVVTSYGSVNGTTWTQITSVTLSFGTTAYVGLAVNSHDATLRSRAVVSNVALTSPGNAPPSVSLTSPAPGSYPAPATINMAATATDPEGQLTRVEFYNGTTLLGSDTTAPYTYSWSNVPAGTYSLTASAIDGAGARATSAAATVTVTSANGAPTATLTSPTSGATFTAPATISMTANASDPENQLSRVEFFNGSTMLASDTSAPYSWSWTNVAAGTYTLTAVAVDAAGNRTTSSAASVTVGTTTSTPPRLVVFTASADHATNVTSYRFDVFTSSANPSTATPVATANLGKPTPAANNDITVDQSTLFSNLAVGNYIATVTAIGPGGSTRSATIAFTR